MAEPARIADTLEAVAKKQIADASEGWVTGGDVARGAGFDADDVDLPDAFREIQWRGILKLTWPGVARLPQRVEV